MTEIIFNPNIKFDDSPILCQLLCDTCRRQYCGSWRNDWMSKTCRECGKGQVKPIVDFQTFQFLDSQPVNELN